MPQYVLRVCPGRGAQCCACHFWFFLSCSFVFFRVLRTSIATSSHDPCPLSSLLPSSPLSVVRSAIVAIILRPLRVHPASQFHLVSSRVPPCVFTRTALCLHAYHLVSSRVPPCVFMRTTLCLHAYHLCVPLNHCDQHLPPSAPHTLFKSPTNPKPKTVHTLHLNCDWPHRQSEEARARTPNLKLRTQNPNQTPSRHGVVSILRRRPLAGSAYPTILRVWMPFCSRGSAPQTSERLSASEAQPPKPLVASRPPSLRSPHTLGSS